MLHFANVMWLNERDREALQRLRPLIDTKPTLETTLVPNIQQNQTVLQAVFAVKQVFLQDES